jgi:hypothetical protein
VNNVGQRALSRILKVSLSTIQYNYKKMRIFKEKFEEFMSSIKGRTFFAYLIIDELYTFYTFYKKKSKNAYIWSAIAVDTEENQHYFYHLSEKKIIKLSSTVVLKKLFGGLFCCLPNLLLIFH